MTTRLASAVSRRFAALLTFAFVGLAWATQTLLATPVPALSRTPPEAYAARAAPLLTSLAAIKSAASAPVGKDDIGQILLDESIDIVEADGRVVRVRQTACRALTEAAIKPLGESVFEYDRDRQKFHLVRAVTILPDGTEQPVAPDAILVQSPQRQADLAVYSDATEVRVIFPRVPVGGITHSVTVTEDTSVRMPGVYTSRHLWGGSWPTALERHVVELPTSLASRLRWFALGEAAADPVRTTLPKSRVRLDWRREALPSVRYEIGRAPSTQVGPALHLTTLATWDEVAAWYQSLLAGRDKLPSALATQADGWLRGAPDRDAKLRILFSKVADDVRYTSLALGDGDYQPQPCAEVWNRRHGDCKDKSNLLVALLRHAGIPAHIALLNTSHLGLIDPRVPDYRLFSHAIVAIPNAEGGYTFCDPTIACALPGTLSGSVTDRDVLIIREGSADWARTPRQKAGRIDYTFDLSLSPAGELSGWLTLSADGVYGAGERERYRDLDNPGRREALTGFVRGFFPGADLIDIVTPAPAASPDPAVARAYFVVPAQQDAAEGPASLHFPRSTEALPYLGTTEQRETAYCISQGEIHVVATIKLPPGTASGTPPAAFRVETPTGSAEARWTTEPGLARAELSLDFRQPSIAPREFPRFYQAMLSLTSWLAQPLNLRTVAPLETLAKDATAPASATPEPAAIDLPLMPTGAGQLELIEKRYPFGGNRDLRRAALQRAIQYFPNDPATAYEAGIHLASLDWDENKNQEAVDRITALLAAHRSSIAPDLAAWGESMQALALRDLGRTDDALALFKRNATSPSLNAWRRSVDALNAAALLESRDPAAADDLLSGVAHLPSEKQASVLSRLARLLLQLDRDARLKDLLTAVLAAQPADADDLLAHLTDEAVEWATPAAPALRARWLALASTLAPSPGTELRAALDRAEAATRLTEASADIQRRLREAVSRPPLATWLESTATPSAAADWAGYTKARQTLAQQNDAEGCVRLGIRTLLALPADADTPSMLWHVAADADWWARLDARLQDQPLLPLLLDLGDAIPKTNEYHFEIRFLRGDYLARRGDFVGQKALVTACLADPALPATFRLAAYASLGGARENTGDLPGALDAYRELETSVANSATNADCILRAVLINLHLGRPAEALRLISVLEKATETTLLKSAYEAFIREFIALGASGQAEAFWAAHTTWWPLWEKLAADLKLPPPGLETSIPVIPDLAALAANLLELEKKKDRPAYWRDYSTVVSAARWLPSFALELNAFRPYVVRFAPTQKNALTRLGLAQLAVPGPSPDNSSNRAIILIATRIDSGDNAAALDALANLRRTRAANDPKIPATNRLWGMAALAAGKEIQEAAAALAQDLANPALTAHRPLTVECLANLLRARGLAAEEIQLLERELDHPAVIADSEAHKKFTLRKDQLGGGARIADRVGVWLRANPIPWYEFAQPATLDDPRLRGLERVLTSPESLFSHAETIKLNLLVAQSPALGIAYQNEALRAALNFLHNLTPTYEAARRLDSSIIDDPSFDTALRTAHLWVALLDSFDQQRPEDSDHWLAHPLVANLNPEQTSVLAALVGFSKVDHDSPQALSAVADSLTAAEIDNGAVGLLGAVFHNYLRLDEIDAARALADSIPNLRFSAGYRGSRDAVALDFARQIRDAESLAPVQRALVSRVRAHFPTLPAQPPASYLALRRFGRRIALLDEDTRETGLWMIGTRNVRPGDLDFWRTLIPALSRATATRALALDLIETAVRAAPDDVARAAVLDAFVLQVDIDDPTILTRLQTVTAPYSDPAGNPQTELFLRFHNLFITLRKGEPADFEPALASPLLRGLATRFALRHYRQQGDFSSLRRTIQGLSSTQLIQREMLTETIPSLQLVGMKTEHRLAREAAERELRTSLLAAWAAGNSADIRFALDLAEVLGNPDPFPPRWVEDVTKLCTDPLTQGAVRLSAAWLRYDWPSAAAEAKALANDYPTHYRYYWYAGAALHRSGRASEARPYLETYTRYAKDEADYPAALALLALPAK